jgi:voltage-gated potassium channel
MLLISPIIMSDAEYAAQPRRLIRLSLAFGRPFPPYTAVGYGDIHPITVLGRLLNSLISLMGIGLVAIPTGTINS